MMLLNHLVGTHIFRVFGMGDVAGTLVTLTLEKAKVFVEHAIMTSIFSRIRMRQMLHHINFYSTGLLIYYVEFTLLQIIIVAVHESRLLHNRCLPNCMIIRWNFYCFT